MENKVYYLLGEKLGHSYSKLIHESFGKYSYELKELPKKNVESFLKEADFSGINVTIPYKETVIPLLDSISPEAKSIGAVNTIVNKDGLLFGYNTDAYGLEALIRDSDIDLSGKNVAILGTGGTSKTSLYVAKKLNSKEIIIVSRSKSDNTICYEDLYKRKDINTIINTTPLGMYPLVDSSPIDFERADFDALEAVVDVVYNPLTTKLVDMARKRGIKACNGLLMLVVQAYVAKSLFLQEIVDTKDFNIEGILDEAVAYSQKLSESIANR